MVEGLISNEKIFILLIEIMHLVIKMELNGMENFILFEQMHPVSSHSAIKCLITSGPYFALQPLLCSLGEISLFSILDADLEYPQTAQNSFRIRLFSFLAANL